METFAERDLIIEKCLYKTDIVEVSKARMRATGEYVAVKKLRVNSVADATFYTTEALQMANLGHHPNIVKLKGCFMSGRGNQIEYVLFVMNFYAKGDLQNEIERRIELKKRWIELELWNHISSLIDVFCFLQEKNVAHRDIKPQNIFVGDNDELLVADLGCVVKKSSGSSEEMTLAGTPLYLSPKLRLAFDKGISGGVDHNPFKSDVYSLGLTFFYMATLEDIFDLANLNQLQPRLNIRINTINYYTDKIRNILKDMLVVEEAKRLDFSELKKKYFNNPTLIKAIPNVQPARSRIINSFKATQLAPAWGSRKHIYKVKFKHAYSKNNLANIFTTIYKGVDWSRFPEYLTVLCLSEFRIKIHTLTICSCIICNYPIDNDPDFTKLHDFFIHRRCIPRKRTTNNASGSVWLEGFDCYYNNNWHFHETRQYELPYCKLCKQYVEYLYKNNPPKDPSDKKNSCQHFACEGCLKNNPEGSDGECPWCPIQWNPVKVEAKVIDL